MLIHMTEIGELDKIHEHDCVIFRRLVNVNQKLSLNYQIITCDRFVPLVKAFTQTKQTFISVGSNALYLHSPGNEIIFET